MIYENSYNVQNFSHLLQVTYIVAAVLGVGFFLLVWLGASLVNYDRSGQNQRDPRVRRLIFYILAFAGVLANFFISFFYASPRISCPH